MATTLLSRISILSLKFCLLSLAIAIILKLSLPLFSELPVLWISIRSWLTPPYLYLVINFIIITIAASSRFQHKVELDEPDLDPVKIQSQDFIVSPVYNEPEAPTLVLKSPVELHPEIPAVLQPYQMNPVVALELEEEEDISSSSNVEVEVATPPVARTVSMEFSKDKPPVSARFGHRKMIKSTSEAGKSLKVSKPKRQDTLESTWKMITEGRSVPLTRHLRKSDTCAWETHGHSQAGPPEQVKKSETFTDHSNATSSSLTRSQGSGRLRKQGSGKLRKEPSLGQEELNRKVEAFINKFNEEMRLQRLESLNRYKQMTTYGDG